MYSRINLLGCFPLILILMIFIWAFTKLWWLVLILVILYSLGAYIQELGYKIKDNKREQTKNYTPPMGETYKICPYCGTKVKPTTLICPVCNRELN